MKTKAKILALYINKNRTFDSYEEGDYAGDMIIDSIPVADLAEYIEFGLQWYPTVIVRKDSDE